VVPPKFLNDDELTMMIAGPSTTSGESTDTVDEDPLYASRDRLEAAVLAEFGEDLGESGIDVDDIEGFAAADAALTAVFTRQLPSIKFDNKRSSITKEVR
jgi:hypothetical protein